MPRSLTARLVATTTVVAAAALAAAWTPVEGTPAARSPDARHSAASGASAVAQPPNFAAIASARVPDGPSVTPDQYDKGEPEPWAMSETLRLARKSEDFINDERAAAGLNRLSSRWDLRADAIRQAEAMADRGVIFHQDMVPLLRKWNAVWVSENVAMNYQSEGAWGLVMLWMRSTGHRLNLLNSRATHTGCGVVQRGGWNWSSCVYADAY